MSLTFPPQRSQAITAITAQLNKQYASQLAAAAANGAAAGLQSSSAQQPGLPGGDAPGSAAPTRPATAAPPFPFAALASAAAGGGEGGAGDAGLSLDLLRALAQQDDDSIGSVLVSGGRGRRPPSFSGVYVDAGLTRGVTNISGGHRKATQGVAQASSH